MKKVMYNYLDNEKFSIKTGITTRIIDRCIQEFFENGFTFLYEGRGGDDAEEKTRQAMFKFCARMKLEHPNSDYVFDQGIFDGIFCFKISAI